MTKHIHKCEEIDSLDFEVNEQELSGKSGSGWFTAVQLSLAGRCGRWFTGSFEGTSNNVSCGK
ncbi:salivaricin M family lantibiotic [Streptococcus sp. 2106]|uniref:salivaricin M family lantibiotic n=1 Tax=Streptococcus sp. 2106 TaxID=2582642 RepID=UPI001562963A|nr:salivaricin M family lantibiotic [Streptococcus sp. 2106]